MQASGQYLTGDPQSRNESRCGDQSGYTGQPAGMCAGSGGYGTGYDVNPGFGGQSYIESCTGKVQKLRKMITDAGLDVDIQVDGGINEKTIDKVLDAGANILVAGSAVFGGNIGENVRCLKEKMESR